MLFPFQDQGLLAFVSALLGRRRVSSLSGQAYRMSAEEGHLLDWHSDDPGLRRAACLTVTLGAAPFRGGQFQIRRKGERAPLRVFDNVRAGDALLFRVDPRLQHRNTPVVGLVPKDTVVCWFS